MQREKEHLLWHQASGKGSSGGQAGVAPGPAPAWGGTVWMWEARAAQMVGERKATPNCPLTSFSPTYLQVCYEQEILGCILIKQWNFYFFFS